MAYRIRYTDAAVIKEFKPDRKSFSQFGIVACVLLLLGALLHLKTVQDFLIPGDPDVTRAAFHSFTRELREGEPFSEAAAVFCRQIIESDNVE